MPGADYLRDIERTIGPNERAQDVVVMIDILAEARTFDERPVRADDFRFAAAILCAIMRPVKPTRYQQEIALFRQSFVGIEADLSLQSRLRQSFTDTLLQAPTPQVAIEQGVGALFRLPRLAT